MFQLIKTVLDDSYAEIAGTDPAKDALIQTQLAALGSSYVKLASGTPTIDYGDAATRLAYVFRYVTSHAHLVASAVDRFPELQEVLARERMTVACVGGGPGSDFLGLLHNMMRRGCTGTMRCFLLDREAGWGDAWSDVGERLKSMSFSVFSHFQALDVSDDQTWVKQRKYLSADLFTMVYFMSEIYSRRADVESFFKHLFGNAKSGAYFLFIENNDSRFTDWIDELGKQHGLTVVRTYEEDARLPTREQKSDLEPYCQKFGGQPKLTAKVAYRLFQKP